MKSIRPQKALSYIAGSGLKLNRKEDIFLRTTTQTGTIQTQNK